MAQQPAAIAEARKYIREHYGATLEAKASDAFCLRFGSPVISHPVTAESLVPIGASDVILEFDRPKAAAEQTKPDRREADAREKLVWALKDAGSILQSNLPSPVQVLKRAQVRMLSERVYRDARPITTVLESRMGNAITFAEFAEGRPAAPQICWLNGTVRARARPESLADVAADRNIQRIGLPRRLMPEAVHLGAAIGAPAYRQKKNRSGKGIIVAVIDSETDKHAAFGNRLVQKANLVAEPWGNAGDHGTAVAGIIGGNSPDFLGIAPEVTIYNYKVMDRNGSGGDDFGGSMALQQAVEDDVHVANCSWGAGPATDGTSREAVACNTAWALGLTIVKSAGNRGPGGRTLTTPADADGVIVVGATDNNGSQVQDYSSRGPTPGGKTRPHLVAPGGSHAAEMYSCLVGGGYGDCGVGTSYAAPHVAGLLCLLLEDNPQLSPDELRDLLIRSCKSMGNDANTYGAGLANIAALA